MPSRNLKITIEYDGTNYAGWQRQKNAISIQASIEDALAKVIQEPVKLTGAGRTDAGVHAAAQVANFHTSSSLDPINILRGANSILPEDIAIQDIEEVPEKFNARRSARLRWYQYKIYNSPVRPVLQRRDHWHVPQGLNLKAMEEVAVMLRGTHDFKGFRSQMCTAMRTELTMEELTIQTASPFISIDIKCRSFLHNMVRIIVGLTVEVGRGKLQPLVCREMLDTGERNPKALTAPPHGLTLMKISYQ
jgi:tRNA pseudouridine38-40 synthase